jgi:hypothetical protein
VRDNYGQENAIKRTLLPRLQIDLPYELVPEATIEELFTGKGGWEQLYTTYPGSFGLMIVSAVGFDQSKSKAMVFIVHKGGPAYGSGGYHFLAKQADGRWIQAFEKLVFVS